MNFSGTLQKMIAKLTIPIEYFLPIGIHELAIANYIDRWITINYSGDIFCIKCNRKINRSFAQGYCYPCFLVVPETSKCILKPELCQAQDGISRDKEWSNKHCLSSHFVYLSLTSGIKVGVTRESQIPTRWIDQGAIKAIKLAKTPNRYIAGLIELEMKKYISDRTAWQRMLKNLVDRKLDLLKNKQILINKFPKEYNPYIHEDDDIIELEYPIINYPEKIKSINLDKIPVISGTLTGIKGQYLYFDNERVLNIRKHQGYKIDISI